jgi:hypothetical protein
MAERPPRRRFKYRQLTPEEVERQLQYARFDEIMRQARDGNLAPLHDYFRSFLPSHHADALIEFTKQRLRRDIFKKPPSPEREAEDAIAAGARYQIKKLQRRFGKLPRGTYQQVIDKVAEWLAEDGELDHSDPTKINFKRIGTKVRRGKAKRK